MIGIRVIKRGDVELRMRLYERFVYNRARYPRVILRIVCVSSLRDCKGVKAFWSVLSVLVGLFFH